MSPDETRSIVLRCIRRVAPEVNPDEIEPDVNLRDQLDIDSMDFLNIVIAIDRETGVDIPEENYPELLTLDALVSYVHQEATAAERRGHSDTGG